MVVIPVRVAKKPWKPWKTLQKPWILFAPGKSPWKTLKLQPTPEKLCSETDFPCINFWPCSAVAFFIPLMQGRSIYEVIGGGGKNSVSCHVTSSLFFQQRTQNFK